MEHLIILIGVWLVIAFFAIAALYLVIRIAVRHGLADNDKARAARRSGASA